MDFWIVLLFLLLLLAPHHCTKMEEVDLTSDCREGDSLKYKLDFPSHYPPAIMVTMNKKKDETLPSSCNVEFHILREDVYLTLVMEKMDIGSGRCSGNHTSNDFMTIKDKRNLLTSFDTLCGNWEYGTDVDSHHKFITKSGLFAVKFKSFPGSYSTRFVVSALEGPVSPHECKDSYSGISCCSECVQAFCISNVLHCDGHWNCDPGHNGDEDSCGSSVLVEILAATLTALLIFFCIAMYIFFKRSRPDTNEGITMAPSVHSGSFRTTCRTEDNSTFGQPSCQPMTHASSMPLLDQPPSYHEAMRSASQSQLVSS